MCWHFKLGLQSLQINCIVIWIDSNNESNKNLFAELHESFQAFSKFEQDIFFDGPA